MTGHVFIHNINGNPHDARLYGIGYNCKGRWDRRKVRRDDHWCYVLLDGIKWYLDDPDTNWTPDEDWSCDDLRG